MQHFFKIMLISSLSLLFIACGSGKQKQLQNKWKMDGDEILRQMPEEQRKLMSKEDEKLFTELMESLYVEFKDKGQFESNIKGDKAKGTWKLNEDETILIITVEAEGEERIDTLKILEISDDKLVLAPQGEENKLILTASK